MIAIVALLGVIACKAPQSEPDSTSAASYAEAAAVDAREATNSALVAPPARWYAADVDFVQCIPSRSPASRIDELRRSGLEPTTKDLSGSDGVFIGVEVTAPKGDLEDQVWTYYNSQTACTTALAQENAIPAKYGNPDDSGHPVSSSDSDDAKWAVMDAQTAAKAAEGK